MFTFCCDIFEFRHPVFQKHNEVIIRLISVDTLQGTTCRSGNYNSTVSTYRTKSKHKEIFKMQFFCCHFATFCFATKTHFNFFFSNFMILKFIEKISWQGTHGVLLDSFVVFVLNANEGFQTKMSQCHVFVSRLRPPCSSCYINDFQQGLWIGTGFSNVF